MDPMLLRRRRLVRTSRPAPRNRCLSLVFLFLILCLEVKLVRAAAPRDALNAGLVGHWRLQGDCRDYSRNGNHGANHGCDLAAEGPSGKPGTAARFDGRGAYIQVPHSASLALGRGDFSIAAWLHTERELDDVIGDIASKYDPHTRRGFNLSVMHHAGMTSSTSNYRNVHFGIDDARLSPWQDCGRPGEAAFVSAMAVHGDNLYVGTYEHGADRAGHVYRYDGDGRWTDCGSPDGANAVMTLCPHEGMLFAGTACYRARGSLLPDSPNTTPGGRVYRYLGGTRWAECGRLGEANEVYALAVLRGTLYGIPMYSPGVFRLDGENTWTYCGTPGDNRSMALSVWNGSLYVTGNGGAGVWRYLGGAEWDDCGRQAEETQTYSVAIHRGDMYVGTWPNGSVWRYQGGTEWLNCGRLGEEKEVMAMAVYNGKLYCGTLPSGNVYRHDGDDDWTLVGELDRTPDVRYRRVWTMAVYNGKLFAGTLPSGHVHCMEAGAMATVDRELPPGWHHLAAVKSGDRLRVYLDGQLAAESTPLGPPEYDLADNEPLNIGFGAHDRLSGLLSDVRLYGRALSSADARALFEGR